ncbi:MAG: FHA domain-containing protein [Thermomicrobiales bacterium]|nr:FHA domain-containing protein [Thermomicrobiales bacterium]
MLPVEIPIPYDWFFLGLRLAFVGLLYLFLWQVLRVIMRDVTQAARQPARHRASRARLVVIDAAESEMITGASFSVSGKSLVGRRTDCAVVIDAPFVSAVHAELDHRNNAWYVTDLDSTNGTFVNGRRIAGTAYIETDDVVQFGRVKFQFVA